MLKYLTYSLFILLLKCLKFAFFIIKNARNCKCIAVNRVAKKNPRTLRNLEQPGTRQFMIKNLKFEKLKKKTWNFKKYYLKTWNFNNFYNLSSKIST